MLQAEFLEANPPRSTNALASPSVTVNIGRALVIAFFRSICVQSSRSVCLASVSTASNSP